MNLSQLRYFRRLSQILHFTKAAESLSITQPALSNSIKQLENELGVPLFEQQGRTVRLTKWGREFESYVSQGLDIIDKGVSVAQEHADNLSGTIDIGTIYTVQCDYLPELLQTYRSRYGSLVDVRLYQGLTRDLLNRLEEGTYDIAIAARMDGRPQLSFIPILYQRLVCLVHEDSPLAQRESITLAEVVEHSLVTYRRDTPVGKAVEHLLEGFDPRVEERCDDEITLGSTIATSPHLVGLSLDTLGLAPFPQLHAIPLEDVDDSFHVVHLAYRRNGHKTRAVENMIALAQEKAKADGFLL